MTDVEIRITVSRPKLTQEETDLQTQELRNAVAAFFVALRQKEKEAEPCGH